MKSYQIRKQRGLHWLFSLPQHPQWPRRISLARPHFPYQFLWESFTSSLGEKALGARSVLLISQTILHCTVISCLLICFFHQPVSPLQLMPYLPLYSAPPIANIKWYRTSISNISYKKINVWIDECMNRIKWIIISSISQLKVQTDYSVMNRLSQSCRSPWKHRQGSLSKPHLKRDEFVICISLGEFLLCGIRQLCKPLSDSEEPTALRVGELKLLSSQS